MTEPRRSSPCVWTATPPSTLPVQLAGQVARPGAWPGRSRRARGCRRTRALAAELGVARGVVEQAFDQLHAEGWVTTRRGAGTFVERRRSAPGIVNAVRGAAVRAPVRASLRRALVSSTRGRRTSIRVSRQDGGGPGGRCRRQHAARAAIPDPAGLPELREPAGRAIVARTRGVDCDGRQRARHGGDDPRRCLADVPRPAASRGRWRSRIPATARRSPWRRPRGLRRRRRAGRRGRARRRRSRGDAARRRRGRLRDARPPAPDRGDAVGSTAARADRRGPPARTPGRSRTTTTRSSATTSRRCPRWPHSSSDVVYLGTAVEVGAPVAAARLAGRSDATWSPSWPIARGEQPRPCVLADAACVAGDARGTGYVDRLIRSARRVYAERSELVRAGWRRDDRVDGRRCRDVRHVRAADSPTARGARTRVRGPQLRLLRGSSTLPAAPRLRRRHREARARARLRRRERCDSSVTACRVADREHAEDGRPWLEHAQTRVTMEPAAS